MNFLSREQCVQQFDNTAVPCIPDFTEAFDDLSSEDSSDEPFNICGSWDGDFMDEIVSTPYGVKSAQGHRSSMEDTFCVQDNLAAPLTYTESPNPHDNACACVMCSFQQDLIYFGVFDGHGGSEVSEHCANYLHLHLSKLLSARLCCSNTSPSNFACSADSLPVGPSFPPLSCVRAQTSLQEIVKDSLKKAFRATDEDLKENDSGEFVGATAIVAIVNKENVWVAHCGDSRAVIQRSGKALTITKDHKPDREDEAERVKTAGGRVIFQSGSYRVMGFLAMSRAIGDHFLRPYVIAEPEVTVIERDASDELLVIASDGLWDVFTPEEATNLASKAVRRRGRNRPSSRSSACRVAATVLTNAALARGSRDNVTVIVVDLTQQLEKKNACGGTDIEDMEASPDFAQDIGSAPSNLFSSGDSLATFESTPGVSSATGYVVSSLLDLKESEPCANPSHLAFDVDAAVTKKEEEPSGSWSATRTCVQSPLKPASPMPTSPRTVHTWQGADQADKDIHMLSSDSGTSPTGQPPRKYMRSGTGSSEPCAATIPVALDGFVTSLSVDR